MIDAKLLDSIQILAIAALEEPNAEDFYRKICRWYSREFSTPLMAVEDIDPVYVLQHYFEDVFDNLRKGSNEGVLSYEKIKAQLLFPGEIQEEEEKIEDWVKKLEEETAKVVQTPQKSIYDLGRKVGGTMANALDEVLKNTEEELNLLPEGLQLPDSGSFGEES